MRVTDYISAILVGVVIGVLGRLTLPGRQRIGAFSTFVIGVLAALLGLFVARLFGIDGNARVTLWKLRWDWIVLAVQVGLAAVGIAVANVLTYTRLAEGTPRRTTRRRRTRTS
jgi:uncharacterized membrane protein YeaQ/YmgE (transglycosylase-associated protein family)